MTNTGMACIRSKIKISRYNEPNKGYMDSKTSKEWETQLGSQIRTLRLRQDLDQRQLAERAGIALNAVKNLERGKGATLRSLIQVLRVLNRTDWLSTLAPTVSISPIQMLRTNAPRQRASPRRKKSMLR